MHWNGKREILLRTGLLFCLAIWIGTGFLGIRSFGLALNYHSLLYGFMSEVNYDNTVRLVSFIGLGAAVIELLLPVVGVIKSQQWNRWKGIILNALYMGVLAAQTLGFSVYSLTVLVNWEAITGIVLVVLLSIGLSMLVILLMKEAQNQWKIRTALEYVNTKLRMQPALRSEPKAAKE